MVLDGITQKLLGSKSTAASVTLGTGNLIVIAHKLHKVTVIHSLALTITVKISFGQNHLLQNPFTIGRKTLYTVYTLASLAYCYISAKGDYQGWGVQMMFSSHTCGP